MDQGGAGGGVGANGEPHTSEYRTIAGWSGGVSGDDGGETAAPSS